MPKYSIIIPTYNVAQYLNMCVESVLNQSYSNYEIIIVDDGSTDSSGLIADSLAEKHSEYVRVIHQKNGGLGCARNTGFDNATGEYIWFVDSDDTVAPDSLQLIDNYMLRHEVSLLVFDYKYVDESGKMLSLMTGSTIGNSIVTLQDSPDLLFMPNTASNKIYHHSLFDSTGIRFPERMWFEDLATILRLYPFASGIGYLNDPLYNYLQRTGSIMNNANVARNSEIIDAFSLVLDFYKEQGLYERYADELEYIAIFHIYILASVRVLKITRKSPLLHTFKNYLKAAFPQYPTNKYLSLLSKKEKLIFKLLESEKYFTLKLLLSVKNGISR